MTRQEKNIVDKNLEFANKLYLNRIIPDCKFPFKDETHLWINDLLAVLFPHFSNRLFYGPEEIDAQLQILKGRLIRLLVPVCITDSAEMQEKANTFFDRLPEVHKLINLDAIAIDKGDPASEGIDEVILTYPGFYVIAVHRLAHELCKLGIKLLPRLLSEYAHQLTGVDIHPGARIGKSFCIDHGTGTVIGETTHIGDNVKIYQNVTIGALSVDKKFAKSKRHPTIEDNVVIYSGATILGGNTTIGKGSIIGGNVWLTSSVPPDSIVYHRSEIHVKKGKDNFAEPINFVI